jgi:hypothetical protein
MSSQAQRLGPRRQRLSDFWIRVLNSISNSFVASGNPQKELQLTEPAPEVGLAMFVPSMTTNVKHGPQAKPAWIPMPGSA